MNNLKSYSLAINSLLILLSSATIGTIAHELSHFAAAKYFNLNPELHHNYVRFAEGAPDYQQAIVAGVGPLFSLILGIIVLFFTVKYLKPSLLKLYGLWFGMGSILCFLGYLLIAPIASNGDTGKVFHYFGFPMYLSIAIAIASFAFINILFAKFAKYFIDYAASEENDQVENKKQLFLIPIYGSILLGTLLNLPVITWVSLLPCIFMPMTYFSTMGAYEKLKISYNPLIINKISIPLLLLTLCSIVLFRYLI